MLIGVVKVFKEVLFEVEGKFYGMVLRVLIKNVFFVDLVVDLE